MAEYYMILTVAGQAAYARAGAGGNSVQISAVAVGDGGGGVVQPAESWTALVGEVWRGAPTLVAVDEANPRLVVVEAHVPHNVGGWYAREIGLLSPEGVLLAVGNYPESYKPVLDSGVGKELLIRAYIEHGNASQTTLKINPDIVMASRTYVVSAVAAHDASHTAHAGQFAEMNEHFADLANPHQVTAMQAGAEPAGAVAAHNESGTAHEDIRELITDKTDLATAAEVLAGTHATKLVTPATLLAGLLGAGGGAGFDYVSIPYRDRTTGARKILVIQWGVNQAIASTGTFVTLPIAYPNGVMRHFSAATTGPGVNGSPVTFGITGYSATGATVFCYINGIAQASACNWFSIGF